MGTTAELTSSSFPRRVILLSFLAHSSLPSSPTTLDTTLPISSPSSELLTTRDEAMLDSVRLSFRFSLLSPRFPQLTLLVHLLLFADMNLGEIGSMRKLGVTESYKLKRQVVSSASEAAEMILR